MISLIRKILKNDLIIGIFFIIFSFLGFILPLTFYGKVSSIIVAGSYYLGGIFIAEYIIKKLGNFSLLSKIFGSAKEKRKFLILSAILGIFFSFIASDLGGLWYFPYWSVRDYLLIGFVLGGWAFYVFFVISCYEAGKLIFDRIIPSKKITKYYSFEKNLYQIIFYIGIICFLLVSWVILVNTNFFSNFSYIINQPKNPYLEWHYWIITFVGSLFICEYFEYRKKRTSLLKDTLHGYFSPILSIFFTSTILAITNEIQNLNVYLWKYNNYPFESVTFFHIPIFIILAWPLHFILFLEFWRAFGTNTSKIIFENDKIN